MLDQKSIVPKRAYTSPVVQVYGSIRQITNSPNTKGNGDNGGPGAAKTKA